MVTTDGVILAAGRGTRLGSLTDEVPKPMLPIGGAPLIDHLVAAFSAAGVRRLTAITGYLAGTVETHLAATSPLPVAFIRQSSPSGTGGALRLAEHAVGHGPFILSWGDIATPAANYAAVVDAWRPELAGVIGVNFLEDVSKGSAVVFGKDMAISTIIEKPTADPPSNWNNAGIMILGPQIWAHLETLRPSARGELELSDAFASMLAAGEHLEAVPLSGPWFDVGTPEGLAAARRVMQDD